MSAVLSLIIVLMSVAVTGKVIVKSKNGSQIAEFDDYAARFGPTMPEDGVVGYLYSVNPHNACQPVEPPPDNRTVWIALIVRDNCTFVEKVRNVQSWFVAAIVYNHEDDDSLSPMFANSDDSNIHIPSVFVRHSDGRALDKHYCYLCTGPNNGVYEIILKEPRLLALWPFAVVIGTCFILMIIFILVIVIRNFTRKTKLKLSKKHLKKIPTKKFKKGDAYDVCAVCLDEYEEGEKIRILPCSHVYHAKCVDPWLTRNKRSCPVCKCKVIPRDEKEPNSDSDNEAPSLSERTPLLNSISRVSQSSSSLAFENLGLPAETQYNPANNELNNHTYSEDSGLKNGTVGENRAANSITEPTMAAVRFVPTYESTSESKASTKEKMHDRSTRNFGAENAGFVGNEESENDGAAFLHCADAVVFTEPERKEEKKHSRIV